MRTRNLFIALTLLTATAAITACNDDENPGTVDLSKPIDVNLSIGQSGIGTRATVSDGNGTSSFETGDKISLTAVTKTGTGDDAVAFEAADATYRRSLTYTYGNSPLTDGTFYWQNIQDKHCFYAYYPAQANFPKQANGNYTYTCTVTLPTSSSNNIDYSTLAKLNEGNFMYGKADSKATNSGISLSLSHCMSQITFSVQKGNGYASGEDMPTIEKAEILNGSGLYTTGTFNLSAGTVTASGSGVNTGTKAIAPYRPTTTATTWYAIVFPGQSFASGSKFVRFTASGGTTYTYELEAALNCEANYSYNYTLNLNRKSVSLSGLTIAKWSKEEKTGSAGMDIN